MVSQMTTQDNNERTEQDSDVTTRLDWLRIIRDQKHMQMVWHPTQELKDDLNALIAEIEKLEAKYC